MNIIGISALFHDAGCCLIKDDKVIAFAREERFTRVKGESRMPKDAFMFCLEAGNLSITDVDIVAYYELPEEKAAHQFLKEGSNQDTSFLLSSDRVIYELRNYLGYNGRVEFFGHHTSHVAAVLACAGVKDAAVMVHDAVGDKETSSYWNVESGKFECIASVTFPDSIQLLASTVANYLGFYVNRDETLMYHLARMGKPVYKEQIGQLIEQGEDGQYKLKMKYFGFLNGERMYQEKFEELFGKPARSPEEKVEEFHCDVARSFQEVLFEMIRNQADFLYKKSGKNTLCIAGMIASNTDLIHYLEKESKFSYVYAAPVGSDAISSLGAATLSWREHKKGNEILDTSHLVTGRLYGRDYIKRLLEYSGIVYEECRSTTELATKSALLLAEGNTLVWYQKAVEMGDESLGKRSILAAPDNKDAGSRIKQSISKDAEFMTLSAAVIADDKEQYFEDSHKVMTKYKVEKVISKFPLPLVTDCNNNAYVWTVKREDEEQFYLLLEEYKKITGCSVLANESLKSSWEPVVEEPEHAIEFFFKNPIDYLVLDHFVIAKKENETLIQKFNVIRDSLRPVDVIHEQEIYTFIS